MAVNLNETATLTLRADGRDLANELTQLDTKAKDLRTTLKDIEKNGGKGSEEWKKYKAELKDVQVETKNLKKEVDITTLTYGQLGSRIKDLNRELKSLKPGTDDFNKAAKNLGEAEKQFKKVGQEVDKIKDSGEELAKPTLWQKIGSGVGIMAKAFQAFVALQIIGYVVDIGKAIFETTAKFEKYEKVLTTAFGGNVKLARESMAALKQLGATTAFSVDELTDGYVKMVNRGLRPTQKEMVALTDLAASQGKTFDQLVEGLLDAATGEFERLKEFGTRASKAGEQVSFKFKDAQLVIKNTGEGFEVLDKVTGKVVNTFKNQEDATLGVLTALGTMKGVGGQNAEMMETLAGKSSNLGDSFDALMVELGTGLRPIFTAILDLISKSIPALSLLGKAIGTALLISKSLIVGVAETITNTGQMLFNFTKAAIELAQGNVEGAKKTWDQTKAYGKAALTSMGENVKIGVTQIVNTWKDPNAGVAAQFAGKDQGGKFQKELTKEQEKAIKDREKAAEKARKKEEKDEQKHLEDVRKANEKALEDLAKIEAETHITSIKDEMQREFVKLMVERDQKVAAIGKTVADEKNKNAQIAALDLELQTKITKVSAEYGEKRRKKAEELDKQRLEAEKAIIEQQKQAENALLDWRELNAKGNAKKLNDIHRERENTQYRLTVEKLNAEESAEKAKAAREITDKEQLRRALEAIEGRYDNERQLAEKKHSDAIEKINKELQDKKKEQWNAASNAFSALLKGDLSSFVDYADKIFEGEKSAWQKRLAQNVEKYAAVAQMATAAVSFLNQLEQQKAERAIAEATKERDAKVKLLNDQIQLEKVAQDAAEFEKQKITQESNDKIQTIKDSSQKAISDLESQYRQLSSSEEKRKLDEQLQGYRENADGKTSAAKQAAEETISAAQDEAKQTISAAQLAEKEAIKAATNAKLERIDAAEATRDAEIAAIEKRKDVDQATRKQLLAEAKDKFDQEKKLAEDEATVKIEQAKDTAKTQTELAKETAKTKTELAKDQAEAELKAIGAVQKGDEKAAKEILAKAKEDQKEKIRLAKEQADKAIEEAEKEKREKLKKVEAEKQTRIQNQKELNRQIEAENVKARAMEAAAKRKQWEAQKKADVASALITGALATLKALASSFWPANLVFAAMSAIMTGVQVAMIKSQPAPQFRHGGFVAQGGRHGSEYGRGGIALIDRQTGRETGEMEGDEAIISREQTAANRPLIEQMFSNARTPGSRHKPVDRGPALRNGGMLDADYWSKGMFLYGGIKPAKKITNKPKLGYYEDGGMYEGATDPALDTASADSEVAIAQAQGKEQLRLLGEILKAITLSDTHTTDRLKLLESQLMSLDKQQQSLLTDLERTNRAGFLTLNNDLTKAIRTASEDIIKGLKVTSSDNGKGLEALSLQQRNSFTSLANSLTRGFTGLTLDTKQGFEGMSKDVVNAIETLSDDTKLNIETLSKDVVTVIEKQSKDTNKSLEDLSKAVTKSLDKLSENTEENLVKLDRSVTKSLGDLSDDTTGSLDTLSKAVTRSLDTLSTTTERSLEHLSTETKRGLDNMANQVSGLRGSINAVEGAVYQVRDAANGTTGAVYGTNNAGRLDALISSISSFGGK
ncbi:hypothetical protein GCM10028818_59920 [Spirosoma horti]